MKEGSSIMLKSSSSSSAKTAASSPLCDGPRFCNTEIFVLFSLISLDSKQDLFKTSSKTSGTGVAFKVKLVVLFRIVGVVTLQPDLVER